MTFAAGYKIKTVNISGFVSFILNTFGFKHLRSVKKTKTAIFLVSLNRLTYKLPMQHERHLG